MQKWFFESNYSVPSHFNQSFLVKVSTTLDTDKLQKAVNILTGYHDAFRLRYDRRKNGNQLQYYDNKVKKTKASSLKILDVSGTASEEEMNEVLTSWQSSFNLTDGPLYLIGYIHGLSDGSSRIFFALHHLIVDSVSWRILTEDLRNLYNKADQGETLELSSLGPKGTSYRQWVSQVTKYKGNHKEERHYWNNRVSDVDKSNNVLEQHYIKSSKDSISYSSLSLSKDLTSKLLKESSMAYNTEVNDLLLSSLALALDEVLGNSVNHIVLEGHGREEEIGKNNNLHLDLSRTIGWFTTMYPVLLAVKQDGEGKVELASTIKYIKELLRQIPNKGIGFGSIMGYKEKLLPKISFNYLGQLDQTTKDWSITGENSGVQISPKNNDRNIININGAISEGILSFSIGSKLNKEITTKLTKVFKSNLEEIVNHTSSLQRSYLTVSDISNIISQEQLDKLQKKKEVESVYLASSLQQGFIYHYLNQGDTDDAYLVQSLWEYKNKLDIGALKKAWQFAQIKHPTLRLRFNWDEELLQIIDKEGLVDFRYIELSDFDQEDKIREIQQKDRLERYKLEEGNLFRVYIIKQRDDLYTCIFSSHHAILDGWSNPILLNYVHDTYRKLLSKERTDESEDHSYLEAQKYLQDHKEDNIRYFQNYISKIEEKADLSILISTEKKKVRLSEYKQIEDHKEATLEIKGDLYGKLKRLSQEEGITLNAILQYVWHKVLKVYGSNNSNNQSITTVVGTTISGRNIPTNNIESSVGLYINTLPIIVEHDSLKESTIIDAIRKLQSDITEINTRSNINLAKLQKEGVRLFDTLFVFENYPVPTNNEEANAEGASLNIHFKEAIERLDYPLSVIAYEGDKQLFFTIKYAGELFKEETAKQLISTAHRVVSQIGELGSSLPNDTEEHTLTYLNESEQELILVSYNKTEVAFPHDKTIAQLFEKQAARTPDNIAVVYEGIRLTYKELNERANRLANYLIKNYSITPDTLIALFLDRSEHMIIAILATLKAGGAYVPIDPEYPDERIRYILEDTSSKLIISNKKYEERLRDIKADVQTDSNKEISIVSVDDISTYKLLSKQQTKNPITGVKSTNLAYVIYTSGTTGKPKGVMQLHANVMRLFTATTEWYQFNQNDVWILFHSYVFDFTVWEIWGALFYGGKLIVPSYITTRDFYSFYNLCKKERITVINQTPSAFYQLINITKDKASSHNINNNELPDSTLLKDLRYVILGGEALNLSQLKPWFSIYDENKPKLINMYGITETTVHATYKEIREEDLGNMSYIGKVIPDLRAYILNNDLTPSSNRSNRRALHWRGRTRQRLFKSEKSLTKEKFHT